jgi:hypothetical protein
MVRLRKKGLKEFDVSNERLALRSGIENEIENIMKKNGFRQVQETKKSDWNRSIQLYERIQDG